MYLSLWHRNTAVQSFNIPHHFSEQQPRWQWLRPGVQCQQIFFCLWILSGWVTKCWQHSLYDTVYKTPHKIPMQGCGDVAVLLDNSYCCVTLEKDGKDVSSRFWGFFCIPHTTFCIVETTIMQPLSFLYEENKILLLILIGDNKRNWWPFLVDMV